MEPANSIERLTQYARENGETIESPPNANGMLRRTRLDNVSVIVYEYDDGSKCAEFIQNVMFEGEECETFFFSIP